MIVIASSYVVGRKKLKSLGLPIGYCAKIYTKPEQIKGLSLKGKEICFAGDSIPVEMLREVELHRRFG